MRLENHKIIGVPFLAAREVGGTITPEIVVLHDTAGALEKFSSRDYLAGSPKVSVHFVVERDGTISQLVPTNRQAAHAGQSSYHGRDWCNTFSVGIEIVNPGRMIRGAGGSVLSWWGQDFGFGGAQGGYQLADMTTPQHGSGTWMTYTPEQIAAVEALLRALFDGIPTLRDITTHWYISPGRKIDTNPLFPLEPLRARILGRDDPALQEADKKSVEAETDDLVQIETPGDSLNMRRWPSFNPNVIATLPDGAVVPVLREGIFAGRHWIKVAYGGQEGWIVATYAAPVVRSSDPEEV